MIRASADVGSDRAGVDDPREATQIANVDHAAQALPPPKHVLVSPSAINPGGRYTVQQGTGSLGAAPRSASTGSAQGGTHMHTDAHPKHPLQGGP